MHLIPVLAQIPVLIFAARARPSRMQAVQIADGQIADGHVQAMTRKHSTKGKEVAAKRTVSKASLC